MDNIINDSVNVHKINLTMCQEIYITLKFIIYITPSKKECNIKIFYYILIHFSHIYRHVYNVGIVMHKMYSVQCQIPYNIQLHTMKFYQNINNDKTWAIISKIDIWFLLLNVLYLIFIMKHSELESLKQPTEISIILKNLIKKWAKMIIKISELLFKFLLSQWITKIL